MDVMKPVVFIIDKTDVKLLLCLGRKLNTFSPIVVYFVVFKKNVNIFSSRPFSSYISNDPY